MIWGSGGSTAPREEPEEATEAGRPLHLETEHKGRSLTYQTTEEDTGRGASRVQLVEHPQEEPETLQPEISADSRSLTGEGPGEMDISDKEDSTGITESSPPQIGQGGARKRKPSKDREPSKLTIRPSER